MIGIRKEFSRELYNENDYAAKVAVANYLKKIYNIVVIRPENYNADISVTPFIKDPFLVEVGVKRGWKGGKFLWKWKDVQIEERKHKYLNEKIKVYYFICSKDLERAFVVDGINLKPEYLKEVSNKYIKSGEFFFKVPIRNEKFVDL
jgi:hypothetical protein